MITRRQLEIATALFTGAVAVAVIVSSVEVGSGWTRGGVESGTFPLIAGALVAAGSLVNLVHAFFGPRIVAVRPDELHRVALLFVPAVVFVAAIPFAGLYLAAAGYLFWTLSVQHHFAWWRSAVVVAATMLTLYWLFERTFDVVLPHGWLGAALGL
jgi:hypothetical protein